MGDRANIEVIDSFAGSTVFLYTHWNGTNLPKILQSALAREVRWDDGSYLARVIFQEMIKDDHDTTGYGISSVLGDGDDRVLVVDTENATVSVGNKVWSFSDFVLSDSSHIWEYADLVDEE